MNFCTKEPWTVIRRNYSKLLNVLLALIVYSPAYTQTWVQEANFPNGGRQYCGYFATPAKGYIGFGNNQQVNDLWEYDPGSNTWTEKAPVPEGGGRAEVLGFSIGNEGYITMGFDSLGESNELWKFDPASNTWTAEAPYPSYWLRGAVVFTIDTDAYILAGVGTGGNYNLQVWVYHAPSNTWSQNADMPSGAERYFGVGFAVGNKGYIGTGVQGSSTATNSFWEYDPSSDTWTQKNNFAGGIRVNDIGFSNSSNGFIGMGSDNVSVTYNDFWKYNPATDSWTQEANYPGAGRLAGAGFAIGCNEFMGEGLNASGTDEDDFWELSFSGGAIGVSGDTTICAGSPVTLIATGGSGYSWSPDTALSAATGDTVIANPTSTITYTVTSGTGGCGGGGGSASVIITVNKADTARVNIYNDQPSRVCAGSQVSYLATAVNGGNNPSYQWEINGIDTGDNNPLLNIPSGDSGDVITCVMTSTAACVTGSPATSYPLVVNVISPPVAGFILANADTICSGASIQLTDSASSGFFQWQYSTDGTNFTAIIDDSTDVYTVLNLTQTTYYRIATNGDCGKDTSSVFMLTPDIVPVPKISTNDSIICSSDSALITSSGTYTSYRWNNGDTLSSTFVNEAGGYWLTVTDAYGCSASSAHLDILVYPVPSVSIVQRGDTLSSYGARAYQWIFGDTDISGATSPLYIAHQTGNYYLQITDTNGCVAVSNPVYVVISGVQNISNGDLLSVYPNPSHGYIFINGNDNQTHIVAVEIIDLLGRTILYQEPEYMTVSEWKVNISALPAGLYYIKISADKDEYLQKLIKQ